VPNRLIVTLGTACAASKPVYVVANARTGSHQGVTSGIEEEYQLPGGDTAAFSWRESTEGNQYLMCWCYAQNANSCRATVGGIADDFSVILSTELLITGRLLHQISSTYSYVLQVYISLN
jgi:hypothetical protein